MYKYIKTKLIQVREGYSNLKKALDLYNKENYLNIIDRLGIFLLGL
jgi:hypothetical protein